jgi:hypothetical protein
MTNSDWAAWVQAIGTIIAIGIAIAVPAWQTRAARQDQKEERDKRANGLLLVMYPELMELRYSVTNIRQEIRLLPPIINYATFQNLFTAAKLPATPRLHENIHDGVDFDSKKCAAYHGLMLHILSYEEDLAELRRRNMSRVPDNAETYRGLLMAKLDRIELVAEEAKRAFEGMHRALMPDVQKLLRQD